jgi:hypothetical protein
MFFYYSFFVFLIGGGIAGLVLVGIAFRNQWKEWKEQKEKK